MVVTDSEQHWGKLADDARASAQSIHDDYGKRTLLLIAERYDMLAQRAKLKAGASPKGAA